MKIKRVILLLLFISSILSGSNSYYKDGVLVQLDSVSQNRDINDDIRYFQTENGIKIGTTDEILVKCKVDVDCKKLLNRFNIQSSKNLTTNILIVKVTNSSDVFSISRKLFETGLVEYAHPNFIKKRIMR
ncbi:MAG: hypothetical protein U9Q30_05510 [Campylobacterota bacterium]|nr:hypothetical protein [Campylobacterota bacterium]